jgi:uncharacterized protein
MRTLVLVSLVTLLAIVPISRLRLSSSITRSLGDGPAVSALATLEQHFPSSSNLLVLLESRAGEASDPVEVRSALVEAAHHLTRQLPLEPELAQLGATVEHGLDADIASFVENTMQPAALWYLDETHAQSILERLTPQGMASWVSRIEVRLTSPSPSGLVTRQVRDDPLGLLALAQSSLSHRLPQGMRSRESDVLSRDGTSLLLQIATQSTISDTAESQRIVDAVQAVLDRLLPDSISYDLTGAHAIAAYDARHMKSDIIRSLILSISAVIAVFCVVYRRVSSVLMIVAPLVCSIAWTFAVLSMLGMTVTPPIAVGAAVLAGLNADYAIHYLSAWTHAKSPREALAIVRRPLIGASTTSIIACVVLLFSDFRLIREFALLGVVGLSCSLVATATVAPALSSFLKAPKPRTTRIRSATSRPILAAGLVLLVACGAAWQIAQGTPITLFQSSSMVLHPMPNPPLALLDRVAASFDDGAWTIPVVVRGSSVDDVIEKSRRLEASLKAVPSLRAAAVMGVHSLLPARDEIQRANELRAQIQSLAVAAAFRESVSKSMLNPDLFEPLEPYLERVLTPPPPPSIEDLPHSLRARLLATDGVDHIALVAVRVPAEADSRSVPADVIADLQRLCEKREGCTPTGLDVVRLDVERTLRSELPVLSAAAILAVGFWLIVFFANVRAVLLALVPLVFGMTCLVLVMIALNIRLDMISLAAIPLLIGIGVDDGIFMVGALRSGTRSDLTSAHLSSHRAIITTSVTTAGSFGSLVTTTTPAIQALGLVVALGVILALAGAELILVPLLQRSLRKGGLN